MERRHPCDQCRSRKVRCNYLSPCDRCRSHGLECTTSLRKKRGRKLGSGAVVERLRRDTGANNEHPVATTPSAGAAYSSPLSVSEAIQGAELELPLNSQDETSVAERPHVVDSHQSASPRFQEADQANASTAWGEGIASDGGVLSRDSFYTFDDFAQSLLNPSAQAWHLKASATSDSEFSPFSQHENHQPLVDLMPHSAAHPTSPYTISTVAAETRGSATQVVAFEANDIINRAVDLFFQHMYPTYPILIEAQLRSSLSSAPWPAQSDACMIWALCAATLLHVDSWLDLTLEQRMSIARSYMKLCRETRLSGTFPESPSFADVVCSLFMAIAYFELRHRTTSWIYVREAVALSIASGLHTAATNLSLSTEEREQQQRLYALLFVTERGASILDNFPVSIMYAPMLSDGMLPNDSPTTCLGLRRLCDLFSLLDLDFVRLWNDPHLPTSDGENYGYVGFAHLQERLRRPLDLQGVSDIQRADILVTQQWLRLVFWQAELRMGLVSTTSADPAFAYDFPMEIASSLCDIVKSVPPVAIQVHGLGIFKKQFEIAYSLLDSLTLSNPERISTYYETLRYLLFSLSASPTSQQIYVKTLEKKIGSEQKYRHVSDVQLLRVDGSRRRSLHPSVRPHSSNDLPLMEA